MWNSSYLRQACKQNTSYQLSEKLQNVHFLIFFNCADNLTTRHTQRGGQLSRSLLKLIFTQRARFVSKHAMHFKEG